MRIENIAVKTHIQKFAAKKEMKKLVLQIKGTASNLRLFLKDILS